MPHNLVIEPARIAAYSVTINTRTREVKVIKVHRTNGSRTKVAAPLVGFPVTAIYERRETQ